MLSQGLISVSQSQLRRRRTATVVMTTKLQRRTTNPRWTSVVGAALVMSLSKYPPPGVTAFSVTAAPSFLATLANTSPGTTRTHSTRRAFHASATALQLANDSNNGNGGGLLSKVKTVVKSILPSRWFQSQQEKQAAIERSRRQQDIKSGLTEMLKDAPFPVRMMGGVAASLFSKTLSGMAETMQEQREAIDNLLAQAEQAILADEAVVAALGAPVQVSRQPSLQSSSVTSINGKTSTNIQLGFSVTGSRQSGMAQLTSSNNRIEQLVVQVGGRVLSVGTMVTTPTTKRKSVGSRQGRGQDDIIEAEIIEKETER